MQPPLSASIRLQCFRVSWYETMASQALPVVKVRCRTRSVWHDRLKHRLEQADNLICIRATGSMTVHDELAPMRAYLWRPGWCRRSLSLRSQRQ
jgi:RecB family endonuclease NucS